MQIDKHKEVSIIKLTRGIIFYSTVTKDPV